MDIAASLTQAVAAARSNKQPLVVAGAGSKSPWLGPAGQASMLSVVDHSGLVAYQPSELVVTARCGTPLKELQQALAQEGQELAADPPLLAGMGTVGGAVASGLSGPGRPWLGALRDQVLGVKMISGRAEVLTFGGQVMKNVAGYDIARLMSGSFGGLGLILEVSLRVRPKPAQVMTLMFAAPPLRSLELCRSVARQPFPLTGTFWCNGQLFMRLSGTEAGLRKAHQHLGGEIYAAGELWRDIRDHQHDFFKPSAPDRAPGAALYRLVVPPAAPMPEEPAGTMAVEWGGGLRWLWHADAQAVSDYVDQVGGWAWRLGTPWPVDVATRALTRRLQCAFDPEQIFYSSMLQAADHAD